MAATGFYKSEARVVTHFWVDFKNDACLCCGVACVRSSRKFWLCFTDHLYSCQHQLSGIS
jgi:hypothetical protein